MTETLAELPLTGHQVGMFKAQPGRPKDFVAASNVSAHDQCAAGMIEDYYDFPTGSDF
jgi:hypothetical protein